MRDAGTDEELFERSYSSDSEYPAVFKEMEVVCGIEVSAMENPGRFSN